MAHQISIVIVGAGDRGQLYADLATRDPRVSVAAVADPDEGRRTAFAERHAVPSTRRYSDWRDLADQPRIADAAVIATLDRLHHEPALALAELRTGKRERHLIEGSNAHDPHAGGDIGLVRAFIVALVSGRPEDHLTAPEESLASHLLTWAAEQARLTSTVVHLS